MSKSNLKFSNVCSKCGKKFTINMSNYYARKKNNVTLNICSSCLRSKNQKDLMNNLTKEQLAIRMRPAYEARDKQWKTSTSEEKLNRLQYAWDGRDNYNNNLSEEEKKLKIYKQKETWKNKSNEEKEMYSKTKQDNWKNMPDDKKEIRNKKIGIATKKRWITIPIEEQVHRIKLLLSGQKEWHNNSFSKEREEWKRNIGKNSKRRWSMISPEEKISMLQPMRNGFHEWWINLTKEEKKIWNRNINMKNRKKWNNLSEEDKLTRLEQLWNKWEKWYSNLTIKEKLNRIRTMLDGWKVWHSNLNPKEFHDICLKQAIENNNNLNKNTTNELEEIFAQILNNLNIEYKCQWSNTIKHEIFDNELVYNDIMKGFNNPCHKWDFIIYLKNNTILVDIDGTIHTDINTLIDYDKYGNIFKVLDYQKHKDTQRRYQHEDLLAYKIIISNKNDLEIFNKKIIKINDNVLVENIDDINNKMIFKEFIELLIKLNK